MSLQFNWKITFSNEYRNYVTFLSDSISLSFYQSSANFYSLTNTNLY